MQNTKGSGFLHKIARGFKRFAGAFKEKTLVKLDDYVLEHFMLYHGLVGTTEENEPQFRNIRRDVLDALVNKSSAEIAIALKVPPLDWQDKLEKIMDRAIEESSLSIIQECLLPSNATTADLTPEHVPLRHPDWRVRANAAKALAYLKVTDAVPEIVIALNDSSEEMRSSFMHLAYALGRLQDSRGREALAQHLTHQDPWLRLDAVGALSAWSLADVSKDLMSTMLQPNLLNDYMAVAITKNHPISTLLQLRDPEEIQGALEVVIGLVEAANGPFANDVGRDTTMFEIAQAVAEIGKSQQNARSMRAELMLAEWNLSAKDQMRFGADERMIERAMAVAQDTKDRFSGSALAPLVLQWLKEESTRENSSQLKHVLDLTSRCKLPDAAPYLIPLVHSGHPNINETLDAVGTLGLTEATPQVIEVLNATVNLTERTSKPLSKQPVFEEDPLASKTYWHALKALGRLPNDAAFEILLKATEDFASDKRQQAIVSIIEVVAQPSMEKRRSQVETTITRALEEDPAPSVKIAALNGILQLDLVGLLPEAAKLVGSKETALSREASTTLQLMAGRGHASKVKEIVTAELSSQRDAYKQQRLTKLSDSLK